MLVGVPPFYDESHIRIYQKILALDVTYPPFIEQKAYKLIEKLLEPDLSKRAGCLKSGTLGIQKSNWFAKTNFQGLLNFEEPAPYIPEVFGENDTSNFDHYDEEEEEFEEAVRLEEGLRQSTAQQLHITDPFEDFESVGYAPLNNVYQSNTGNRQVTTISAKPIIKHGTQDAQPTQSTQPDPASDVAFTVTAEA
eukprot:snap_masked-scaffold_6-processed-gene-19.19-mRNA-1 protein AED:0.58 eAED:0.58 QI:0/-1/0/1/-1/1/1/0/193